MSSDGDKYVVFKRDDWDTLCQYVPTDVLLKLMPVNDAVVIRRQDIFASMALWSYVHTVRTIMDVVAMEREGVLKNFDMGRMQELADHFSEQAMMAEDGMKVPD